VEATAVYLATGVCRNSLTAGSTRGVGVRVLCKKFCVEEIVWLRVLPALEEIDFRPWKMERN